MAKNTVLSKIRIIAGQWRGRNLSFIPVEGLRPTANRIRETLFNWLQFHLVSSHCLDLFSGSGALGFEALSRGAKTATFIEKQGASSKQIQANLTLLNSQQAEVINQDALLFLAQNNLAKQYDLVFIDPPFGADLWQPCFELLEQQQWLADNALIYIEYPRGTQLVYPDNWRLLKEKNSGQVCYQLWQYKAFN